MAKGSLIPIHTRVYHLGIHLLGFSCPKRIDLLTLWFSHVGPLFSKRSQKVITFYFQVNRLPLKLAGYTSLLNEFEYTKPTHTSPFLLRAERIPLIRKSGSTGLRGVFFFWRSGASCGAALRLSRLGRSAQGKDVADLWNPTKTVPQTYLLGLSFVGFHS